jgi:rod shape-determining protein MreB
MSENIVYLGIDLGTSRTSIVSSTGIRETVWSYVGYPKDHVAKKKFGGRDIIYGREALDGRMALDLYRPMAGSAAKQKGAQDDAKRKQAIKDLLEHVVALAKIPKGATVYAMIGAPAEASVEGKATILESAKDCIDSVIICSEPYAVGYGLDFISDTMVIDIGAGTTDLCRLHGTMPKAEDQRTHEVAGDAIDQTLATLIKDAKWKKVNAGAVNERWEFDATGEAVPCQFSINMIRGFKEKFSSVSRNMDRAIVEMSVAGKPAKFDITELCYKACYTLVPPTVAALQDLIATYDPEFQAQMRNNILLGGGGCLIKGLGLAIEDALVEYGGGKVTTVEEPQFAGANGALKFALDMPPEYWKEFASARAAAG